LHEQEVPTAAFFTAEGIELKPTYSEQDIENLDHLDFGGFSPYLRGPYTTMYCASPLDHFNMLDFQQPKKVMLFIDVILLQDKRTIDRFRFADTPWV
jgi:methylmalonyl-CoA mutase N-terminal domain/subunit